jgi:hypothetical protein
VRRVLTVALRAAFVAAAVALVRSVLAERTTQRSLQGTAPVIGSLDTWPPVPRRPTG